MAELGRTFDRGGNQSWIRRDQRIAARAVGAYVPELTKTAFQKYGFSTTTMLTSWAEIVGAETAAFTQPERLKWPRNDEIYADVDGDRDAGGGKIDRAGYGQGRPGATLVLRVEPALALDVQYQSRQIVDRINAYFGYCAVSELRILQAPLRKVLSEAQRRPAKHRDSKPAADNAASPITPAAVASKCAGGSDKLALALSRLEANIQAKATT